MRGSTNNGTASGDSGLKTAVLPPLAVRMWVGVRRGSCNDLIAVGGLVVTWAGSGGAYDVVTMLQRDGHPTALGEVIAGYGRIFKSLHILNYIDVDVDEAYRRHQGHPQPAGRPPRPGPQDLSPHLTVPGWSPESKDQWCHGPGW